MNERRKSALSKKWPMLQCLRFTTLSIYRFFPLSSAYICSSLKLLNKNIVYEKQNTDKNYDVIISTSALLQPSAHCPTVLLASLFVCTIRM